METRKARFSRMSEDAHIPIDGRHYMDYFTGWNKESCLGWIDVSHEEEDELIAVTSSYGMDISKIQQLLTKAFDYIQSLKKEDIRHHARFNAMNPIISSMYHDIEKANSETCKH